MNLRELAFSDEFNRISEIRRERERIRQFSEKLRRDEEEEKQEKDKRDEEFVQHFVEMALATPEAIAEFTVKLDAYDVATIEALMANEVELRAVRERLEEMLLEAHTLPDGRRVFKTRDGSRVFDEFGAEMDTSVISPEEIGDDRAKWEDFAEGRSLEAELSEERDALLQYQDRLDQARDRLDDPELTEDELSALDAELGASMPSRVAKQLGLDTDSQAPAPDLTSNLVNTPIAQPRMGVPPM